MPAFSTRDGSALLRVDQVAAMLGVSKRTVQRLVERRALPFYRVSHRTRFDVMDVERYVSHRRVEEVGP